MKLVMYSENRAIQLTTVDLVPFKLLVNGHQLKLYKWLQTKENFLQQFQQSDSNTTQVTRPIAKGVNLSTTTLQH